MFILFGTFVVIVSFIVVFMGGTLNVVLNPLLFMILPVMLLMSSSTSSRFCFRPRKERSLALKTNPISANFSAFSADSDEDFPFLIFL